jgi:2-aminoadipate transaminase
VADWHLLSQILAVKNDSGTGALEQMMLAEYCVNHFDDHVNKLSSTLKDKLETLVEAVKVYFGTSAEFEVPEGVSKLAEICHQEFGVPLRGANRVRS